MSTQIPYSLPPTGTANNADVQSEFDALTTLLDAGTLTPSFSTITLTATANQIIMGTTRTVTLTAPTPASSSRVVTIPDLSGDYSVVGTIGTQSIAGSKTFSSAITITPTTNQIILGTTRTATITAPTPASTSRVYTFPDLSGDYSVVGTIGTQSISGVKTFTSNPLIQFSSSGGAVQLLIDNTSNTASSSAILYLRVGGTIAGNPHILFDISGSSVWSAGLDTSDNSFKISASAALGTNNNLIITATGLVQVSRGDFTLERSNSGGQVVNTINNLSNTASSDATLFIQVAGTSANDAYSRYSISGSTQWSTGLDNSDSDNFKISQSSSLGTNDVLTITTAGLVTVSLGDFTLSRSSSGGSVVNTIANTSNTASSNAELLVQVAGTSANDPFINFSISSSTQWSIGLDNSDSDKFKISQSSSIGTNDVLTITTGGTVTLPLNDFSVTRSFAGNLQIDATNTNNSNTAAHATFLTSVGGTSAGDPRIIYTVSGTTNFTQGIDNSDSDNFKLSASNALGTTDVVIVTTVGEITQPLQPSFLVTDGTGATDQTGDGTAYTEAWPTEIYDQGSDFSSNTFTAPVTGRYQLCVKLSANGLLSTHTVRELAIVTSNREYRDESNYSLAQTRLNMGVAVIADMDSGDTATVRLTVSGSTKVVDVAANASDNTFSGSLIN